MVLRQILGWSVFDLSCTILWSVFDLSCTILWSVFDLSCTILWSVFDLSCTILWSVFDLSCTILWSVFDLSCTILWWVGRRCSNRGKRTCQRVVKQSNVPVMTGNEFFQSIKIDWLHQPTDWCGVNFQSCRWTKFSEHWDTVMYGRYFALLLAHPERIQP